MIKNYITVAFRNLLRNKFFSLVNIFGLAIGISASLVIYLLVTYHFSFDKFESDGERIYRVVSSFTYQGETSFNAGVPAPMGNAVRAEVTGIDVAAPFYLDGSSKVSIYHSANEKPLVFKEEKNIVFADPDYFRLINYKWLAGSAKTALQQPFTAVLTASNATRYFPGLAPSQIIGREIVFDTVRTTITGIVKDLNENTDFTFKTILSRLTYDKVAGPDNYSWNNTSSSSQLFVKISAGTTAERVLSQIKALADKYQEHNLHDQSTTTYLLQPLNDVHFNEKYGNFSEDKTLAHKPTLYGLLAIALFLLLLGCINYINLSTAQATQRTKEIGIRKTMGGSQSQLIFQFLSETFLLTLIAAILSIAIVPLLLNAFADFIPAALHFHLTYGVILFIIALIVVVGLLSGFYPAIVLSGYKPVTVLKNQAHSNTHKTRRAWFRKTLTVSQFVIAQVFIIATILVSKQINYSLNKDLGFKKDAIVYFSTSYNDKNKDNRMALMERLRAIPEIEMLSLSYGPPSFEGGWTTISKYNDGKKETESRVSVKLGDPNYIKLYNIKLLAGTNLPLSDTARGLLINETFCRELGFKDPQEAIGKVIEWNQMHTPIIGVVGDFHEKSLHETIKPVIITTWTGPSKTINVALAKQNAEGTTWKTAISKIEKEWKAIYPEEDIKINFLDDYLEKYYETEKHISNLLLWATGLAIFISCLGLLGLVIYTTNQRKKEIGVRKVIGASILQIVSMLSKDFLKLLLIAFVIAVPIVWWAADQWLQNFAYRTSISWWVFPAGGIIMMLMAMAILGIKTFKAAAANPVISLRTE